MLAYCAAWVGPHTNHPSTARAAFDALISPPTSTTSSGTQTTPSAASAKRFRTARARGLKASLPESPKKQQRPQPEQHASEHNSLPLRRGKRLHKSILGAAPTGEAHQDQNNLRDAYQRDPPEGQRIREFIGRQVAVLSKNRHHKEANTHGHQPYKRHIRLRLAPEHRPKWAGSKNGGHQESDAPAEDRKSTLLNSSHVRISYAV